MAATDFVVRVHHRKGYSTVVTSGDTARDAVAALLAPADSPIRRVVWVKVRPLCEYCTGPGTRYVHDSGEGTPLCGGCARSHYDTAAGVGEHTGSLGISRFVLVPEDEWKDEQG